MLYLNRTKLVLEALGMNVSVETTEDGQEALNATIETKRGPLTVFAIAKGARLGKPNGTSKYLYGCTDGKVDVVELPELAHLFFSLLLPGRFLAFSSRSASS